MPSNKIILITGATSGIGRHCAITLANKGYRVFATGRNQAALSMLAHEAAGMSLETLRLDVADGASISAAREEVERRTGGHGVDVLVNNAGYGLSGPMENVTIEDLRAQFETNLFGLVAVTQAFLPPMKARRSGHVINISSLVGRVSLPFQGPYNASKFALEGLTDAWRLELRPLGIRVVLVEPGAIHTDFENRITGEDTRKRFEGTYSSFWDGWLKLIRLTYLFGAGPHAVTRRIEKIMSSSRPCARYTAPKNGAMVIFLKWILPQGFIDLIIRTAYGLSPRKIR